MPNAREYYRIGKALYRMYRSLEEKGDRELIITAEHDGLITTPEGVVEILERLMAMETHAGPRDTIRVRADPALTEPPVEDDMEEPGKREPGQTDQKHWYDDGVEVADYITHLAGCNAYWLNSKECTCGGRELAKGLRSGEFVVKVVV